MTRLTGRALRLTVFVGENDTWHHKPLSSEIVHRAHAAGLAGASVFRGVEGFGASSLIHTSRLLSLSEDLPVAVVIVDTEPRVRAFLPQLDELVTEGLVTLDDCEVIRPQSGLRPTGGTPTTGREDTPGETDAKGKRSL
ncbi:DUF190 domain-containing protein [Streptomyces sp. DG1A-41]|uniref:DUF190 domain-containing protein n=1 Tax=Streptomyces sp. DG1A-41 TaxID=3125779 RepID=UPI0030D4ACD9